MSDPQPPANPYGDQPPPFAGGYAGGPPATPPAPHSAPQQGSQPDQWSTPLAAASAGAPAGWAPPATAFAPASLEPGKRPGTVTAAGIVTIIFAALTAVGSGLGVVGLLAARDDVLDRVRDDSQFDDFNGDQIVTAGVVVLAVMLFWCLAAILLAVLAMRRSNVARIMLVVSSVSTALFSLIAILSVISLLPLVAAIVVIVLLFTGGANQWYAAKPGAAYAPPGPPPLA